MPYSPGAFKGSPCLSLLSMVMIQACAATQDSYNGPLKAGLHTGVRKVIPLVSIRGPQGQLEAVWGPNRPSKLGNPFLKPATSGSQLPGQNSRFSLQPGAPTHLPTPTKPSCCFDNHGARQTRPRASQGSPHPELLVAARACPACGRKGRKVARAQGKPS